MRRPWSTGGGEGGVVAPKTKSNLTKGLKSLVRTGRIILCPILSIKLQSKKIDSKQILIKKCEMVRIFGLIKFYVSHKNYFVYCLHST